MCSSYPHNFQSGSRRDFRSLPRTLFSGVASLFLLLYLLLCAASCSSESDRVQTLIAQAAANPEARNEQTFNELTAAILESPKKYKQYLSADGSIDLQKLQQAVNSALEHSQERGTWNLADYGGALSGDLQMRLMLERSGSMTAYDSRDGSGNFKRALSEMVTRFPHAQTGQGSILIVNDGLHPYPGTFESFVQDKDIFTSTASLGNPGYTDFAKIFTNSLTDTIPERITILVTDLIYSPKGTLGVTPEKIFNEEGALASSLFTSHLDKSMLIVRLEADYRGKYYPFSGNPFEFYGTRPYFMIITGSAAAMNKLRSSEKYASFADFKSLPGYRQQYFFNRQPLPLPWWSVMPRRNPADGSYTLGGGNAETGAHEIKDARPAAAGQDVVFTVAADLSQIPAEPEYLLDKANYLIDSDSQAQILSIEPVDPAKADARNKRYYSRASHLITLSVSGKALPEKLKVSLLNRLPQWIKQYSSASDSNPYGRFSSTTFGLQPFLQGVYQAYYGTARTPEFTSFTVKFQK